MVMIFSLFPFFDFCLKRSGVDSNTLIVLWFLLYFLLYVFVSSGVLVLFYGELSYANFLDSVYMPLLILSSYLIFCKRQSVIIFVLFIVLFSALLASYMIYLEREYSAGNDIFKQNNWGNVIGASLPFVFLLRNRILALLFLFVGTAVIFYGLKRSGIVVSFLMFLVYFLFYYGGGIIKKLCIFFSILLMLLFYLENSAPASVFEYFEFALARMANVTEDGGSGRYAILISGLMYWSNLDFPWMIFGEGFKAYFRSVGLAGSMHNDFGELLISYGLTGVVFLIFIYFRMFFIIYRCFVSRSSELPFAVAITLAFLVYSNVAGVYIYTGYFISILLGYAYLESRLCLERASKTTAQ